MENYLIGESYQIKINYFPEIPIKSYKFIGKILKYGSYHYTFESVDNPLQKLIIIQFMLEQQTIVVY